MIASCRRIHVTLGFFLILIFQLSPSFSFSGLSQLDNGNDLSRSKLVEVDACHDTVDVSKRNNVKRHNIMFPLPSQEYKKEETSIRRWFQELIDSTAYFERLGNDSFAVPIFGNVLVSLEREHATANYDDDADRNYMRMEIIGTIDEEDFGALAAKLYESQQEDVSFSTDNTALRQLVKNHFQSIKPHPGTDASLTEDTPLLHKIGLFKDDDSWMTSIFTKGFFTWDTNLYFTNENRMKLSSLLESKTWQDSQIRSDTVTFLSKKHAIKCGVERQYEALMAIAHYLNTNLMTKWMDESAHENTSPRLPATIDHPLTNPSTIQIAEYKKGEFYVPHSDNLLLESEGRHANYRRWTAILYGNDNWDTATDGGALRIYPNVFNPRDVATSTQFEDINPANGKLLLFDSRLVHSVEKIISTEKRRIAMTLWINQPEENDGVTVDVWNDEQSKVEWYRLL